MSLVGALSVSSLSFAMHPDDKDTYTVLRSAPNEITKYITKIDPDIDLKEGTIINKYPAPPRGSLTEIIRSHGGRGDAYTVEADGDKPAGITWPSWLRIQERNQRKQ